MSGGGLSSRFRVGRLAFHWGYCNTTSAGSEHSLNGRKYPLEVEIGSPSAIPSPLRSEVNYCLFFGVCVSLIQMQIYCHDPDDFQSLDEAIQSGGRIAALAVLFEVGSGQLAAPPQRRHSNTISPGFQPPLRQLSLEDNENFHPVVDAVNTVSRFGEP